MEELLILLVLLEIVVFDVVGKKFTDWLKTEEFVRDKFAYDLRKTYLCMTLWRFSSFL